MRQPYVQERRHSWNADLRARLRQLENRWDQLHPPIASTVLSDEIAPELEYLTSLGSFRPNVLLIGPAFETTEILMHLIRAANSPIDACRAGGLALPARGIGTLVIHDIERLTHEEQEQLFAWMSYEAGRMQVITISELPLMPLLMRNEFSEALFYRLNQMCLVVGEHSGVV